ncbi:hypothetical protein E2C01_068858 [Portunus trituberculatus]|uniref:Uncharacterized protein n=1 Tax=Portunus trituberculatus TaxID=210409 RepID=A0A5B7I0N3_PORTR|nr:hypothetical protein [Portunus trituberculatus]
MKEGYTQEDTAEDKGREHTCERRDTGEYRVEGQKDKRKDTGGGDERGKENGHKREEERKDSRRIKRRLSNWRIQPEGEENGKDKSLLLRLKTPTHDLQRPAEVSASASFKPQVPSLIARNSNPGKSRNYF